MLASVFVLVVRRLFDAIDNQDFHLPLGRLQRQSDSWMAVSIETPSLAPAASSRVHCRL